MQRLFPSDRTAAGRMVVDTMPSALHLTVTRLRCGSFINQMHTAIIRDALTANRPSTRSSVAFKPSVPRSRPP